LTGSTAVIRFTWIMECRTSVRRQQSSLIFPAGIQQQYSKH
jgi:hypothetical protein